MIEQVVREKDRPRRRNSDEHTVRDTQAFILAQQMGTYVWTPGEEKHPTSYLAGVEKHS